MFSVSFIVRWLPNGWKTPVGKHFHLLFNLYTCVKIKSRILLFYADKEKYKLYAISVSTILFKISTNLSARVFGLRFFSRCLLKTALA